LRLFAFSLAKEQKKTLKELNDSMDASEFMEWIAFEMINDKDKGKKLRAEVALEESMKKTIEQRATDIKKMFQSMGAL
jgi:hypothetical protein